MTTIVGIETGKGVILGCDHLVSNSDGTGYIATGKKIWRQRDVIFGVAGNVRISQAIQYHIIVPDYPDIKELEEDWMCTDFASAVRAALEEGGVSNGDAEWGMLVGVKSSLYRFDGILGVLRSFDGYYSIGNGMDFALGSMYATGITNMNAFDRVYFALEASCHFSLTTGEPFEYLDNFIPMPEPVRPPGDIIPFPIGGKHAGHDDNIVA